MNLQNLNIPGAGKNDGGGAMQTWKQMMVGAGVLAFSSLALGTELTIHLNGSQPISRQTIQYQCDEKGAAMGLPASGFPVEYLNGGGNSLAIVPVHGKSMIFANVSSGSGARYAASDYIWWDAAGRSVSFSSDSLAGKMQSVCHRVNAK
jgi:membrane-bound inhibitor of C-type lysozyme